jgi:hypothetical protein
VALKSALAAANVVAFVPGKASPSAARSTLAAVCSCSDDEAQPTAPAAPLARIVASNAQGSDVHRMVLSLAYAGVLSPTNVGQSAGAQRPSAVGV